MSPTLSYGEENAEVVSEIEEDSSTDEGNNNSWGKVAVVDDVRGCNGAICYKYGCFRNL